MFTLYKTPQNKLLEHKTYLKEDTNPEIYQQKARQYSLHQIEELFYIHLNRSTLCHQFLETQDHVKTCEERIDELVQTDDKIMKYIDEKVDALTLKLDKFEEQSQLQQQYNESKQADLGNRISMHNDSIHRLLDFQRDSAKFQESVKVMHTETFEKIKHERVKLEKVIELNNLEMKQKIADIDKFTMQQFDAINQNMELFKQQTKENIDEREKDILDKTNTRLQELQSFVEDTAAELNRKRIEVQEKYERKFNKVKEVITNYFERYDVDLEEVKINMKILNQKYVDWSKILIEPTSLNEARLYTLETRLHEEEEIRIKEYEFMRDLMKKLIFSLEQMNYTNLEGQKSNTKSIDRNDQGSRNNKLSQLPNLLSTQSINNRSMVQEKSQLHNEDQNSSVQNKTNEILMLKRLNFLKSSLDGHSPRQTTAKLRIKAQQKRDARVIEIWKKEMEAPTVQDILKTYLKNKPEVKIDLSEEPSIDSQHYVKLENAGVASRNIDSMKDDSVIITKRGEHHSLQPLLITNYETQTSQVKNSDDSAFLTQNVHVLNKTAKFGQTFHHPVTNLNHSLGSIETPQYVNLADKIKKNRFQTSTEHKHINQEFGRIESSAKEKMNETFWSEFDNSMKERRDKLQQSLKEKQQTYKIRHGVSQEHQNRKMVNKTFSSIKQDKKLNNSNFEKQL